MKIEITTHEAEAFISTHASLVSQRDVALEQVRVMSFQLGEAESKLVNAYEGISKEQLLGILTQVFHVYHAESKIAAIKMVRNLTSCGLKEAKDCVETGLVHSQKHEHAPTLYATENQ